MVHKKQKRQLNKRARFLLVVVAVILFIFLFFLIWTKTYKKSKPYPLAFSSKASYSFSVNGLVYVDGNKLFYDDLDRGKMNWTMDLSDSNFQVESGDDFFVVYSDNMIQARDFERRALTLNLEFVSKIIKVRCGKDYFAVLRQNSEGEFAISLISKYGKQLKPLQLTNSYALDMNYYNNDELWTMVINSSSKIPVTTISTFSNGESKTGVMSMDSELVSQVFTNNKYLFSVGTNSLRAYSNSGKEEANQVIYGWDLLDFYSDANNIGYFLLRLQQNNPNSQISQQSKIISLPNNTKDINFRLPPNCIHAFFINEKLFAFNNERMYIYDKQGILQDEISFNLNIDKVEKINSSRVLMRSADQFYLLQLDNY